MAQAAGTAVTTAVTQAADGADNLLDDFLGIPPDQRTPTAAAGAVPPAPRLVAQNWTTCLSVIMIYDVLRPLLWCGPFVVASL